VADFNDPDSKPYFLWSEAMTVGELRQILAGSQGPDLRLMYMARIMRECRVPEVWDFLTPKEIQEEWPRLQRRLGRSLTLWRFLMDTWTRHGLL